jgi:hypothetical protein
MTPEDLDQLRQLKNLMDSGVLSAEDFEAQKNLIFASSDGQVVSTRRRLDEMFAAGADVPRPVKSTSETVSAAQRAAVRVQIISYLFAIAGVLFGVILMVQKDEYNEENPFLGAGIGVAVNAVTLSIILFAFGKYMEARLMQGSDQKGNHSDT